MKTAILLAMAAALPSLPEAPGQVRTVLPAEYERAWGQGSTSALGGDSTRTQMVFASPFGAGTTVLGIGLRPSASTVDSAAFTADVEVQVSSTFATPGALNSTFANNIGSDVLVALARQTINVPDMRANRSTGRFAEILFTTPFVFGQNGAPNILVDLFVHGRSAGASWSTDRALASSTGRSATAGRPCGTGIVGSNSLFGTYASGAMVYVILLGGEPITTAFLLLSLDQKEYLPGIPLPVSLGVLGTAPECEVLVRPNFLFFTLRTDPNGDVALAFPVPGGVERFGLGCQWMYIGSLTPANPVGFYTTASRSIWIGPEVVVPNAQYVWELFNVNATTGNATTDAVPIVEFITL